MTTANLSTLLSDVLAGHRLDGKEAELLLKTKGQGVLAITELLMRCGNTGSGTPLPMSGTRTCT